MKPHATLNLPLSTEQRERLKYLVKSKKINKITVTIPVELYQEIVALLLKAK